MSNIDTFSTLVESRHLTSDIDQFRTHLDRWISSREKPTSNDKFEAIYHQLMDSAKNLNEAEKLHILMEFRKYLQALPSLELTIAFDPDDTFKEQVRTKLSGQIKGNYLVKFKVDKEIIAGCLLNFNGKFADYSLVKILEEKKEDIFGPILREIN